MTISVNKKHDFAYESMFDALIQEVFGFSFQPWFAYKPWDERYESYSIIENEKMLSNVCIYKTDICIQGQNINALQFGAVATRESERGKGLSKILMEHVFSIYPDTPSFLFANASVIDFYPRFGFRRAQIYKPRIFENINNPQVKAVTHTVDEFISNTHNRKRVYSNIFDCLNTEPVHIFHLLAEYSDNIYYLPEQNAYVIAEHDGNRLFIVDIVTEKPVAFEELKTILPFQGVDTVEFGFCPEWLGISPEWEMVNDDNDLFFLRGEWDLPARFRFPAMATT